MDPLNITHNADGTWTLVGYPAGEVSISDEVWAELEQSEHVKIDARPPGNQGQPAVTYLQITATNYWLGYTVLRHIEGVGYELELNAYAELG